jgi:uncharacterized circularly permuted ATP-grasp superfamily protein
LNLFLEDIYNEQLIIKKALFRQPWLLLAHYIPEVHGIKLPHDIHMHIGYRFNGETVRSMCLKTI